MKISARELKEKIEEGYKNFELVHYFKGRFIYGNDKYTLEFTPEYRDELVTRENIAYLSEMDDLVVLDKETGEYL